MTVPFVIVANENQKNLTSSINNTVIKRLTRGPRCERSEQWGINTVKTADMCRGFDTLDFRECRCYGARRERTKIEKTSKQYQQYRDKAINSGSPLRTKRAMGRHYISLDFKYSANSAPVAPSSLPVILTFASSSVQISSALSSASAFSILPM